MSVVISSVLPFPNILWWSVVCSIGNVSFDVSEHFEKMSYRNRYYITGANGLITLSIPLTAGREQRRPMQHVLIDNRVRWQVQHWRTLVSVYKRAPYFDHYAVTLQQLFEQPFEKLADFNMATIHWLKDQLQVGFNESAEQQYVKTYPEGITDARQMRPGIERKVLQQHPYYQIFAERNGFYPCLSMLDLLFSEGTAAMKWIKDNNALIAGWKK